MPIALPCSIHINARDKPYIFELSLDDELDYNRFRSMIREYCIITFPLLESEYKYINNIGRGSQASVDLYKTKFEVEP